MNINRHNYEEYFILYMDNELGSEDRRMVEVFIQNNPDLKDELDSLLQYKLEPDTSITFSAKEELMKSDGKMPVVLSNYEEWLILYADNELTAVQKATVDQFIAANPAAKKELELLLKTKLQPETIEFAHKESLYRKEEKIRPVAFKRWLAAAAILLLAAGLTTVIIVNNKPSGATDGSIAKDAPKTTPAELPETKASENPVATVKETVSPANNTTTSGNEKQEAATAIYKQGTNPVAQKTNNIMVDKNNVTNSPVQIKNDAPVVADNNYKPSNNLPLPVNNPNAIGNTPKDAVVQVTIPDEPNNVQNSLTNTVVTTQNPHPSDIQPASYIDEGGSGKKNKLRGFFRKVTRTFEKRTKIDATDGEDRLLIAGLAIKMK